MGKDPIGYESLILGSNILLPRQNASAYIGLVKSLIPARMTRVLQWHIPSGMAALKGLLGPNYNEQQERDLI